MLCHHQPMKMILQLIQVAIIDCWNGTYTKYLLWRPLSLTWYINCNITIGMSLMKIGPNLQLHAMVFQHGPIDFNGELSPI